MTKSTEQRLLATAIGAEKLLAIKKEIESIVAANNLDSTPLILSDFLDFLKEELTIQRA